MAEPKDSVADGSLWVLGVVQAMKEPSTIVQTRLPVKDAATLQKLAHDAGLSMAAFVRILLLAVTRK